MSFFTSIATSIVGSVFGGGKQQQQTTIQPPDPISLRGVMRPTGRGSRAGRTRAAEVSSPSIYGGGTTRYNAILRAMLNEKDTVKKAKVSKA